MRTIEQQINEFLSQGRITQEKAVRYCSPLNASFRGLDPITAARGEATSSLKDLAMEEEEDQSFGY